VIPKPVKASSKAGSNLRDPYDGFVEFPESREPLHEGVELFRILEIIKIETAN